MFTVTSTLTITLDADFTWLFSHFLVCHIIDFVPEVNQPILVIGTKSTKIGQHDVLILFFACLRTSPSLAQAEVPTPVEATIEGRILPIAFAVTAVDACRLTIVTNVVDVGDDVDKHATTDVDMIDLFVAVTHTGIQDETIAKGRKRECIRVKQEIFTDRFRMSSWKMFSRKI